MPPFLMRMLLWVRNPPSRPQQIAIAVVCGIGLLAVGIEHVFGWPDWLRADRVPRGPRLTAP